MCRFAIIIRNKSASAYNQNLSGAIIPFPSSFTVKWSKRRRVRCTCGWWWWQQQQWQAQCARTARWRLYSSNFCFPQNSAHWADEACFYMSIPREHNNKHHIALFLNHVYMCVRWHDWIEFLWHIGNQSIEVIRSIEKLQLNSISQWYLCICEIENITIYFIIVNINIDFWGGVSRIHRHVR